MTDKDMQSIETFISEMSNRIISDNVSDDDCRNMLQTIISLNAEILLLRESSNDRLKIISNLMQAR